ncbi:MAG: peptidoglycan-binding domain-containing protein [Candidatus Nomurabacteria bacterium]|nr:peptidoglycan-binding domain-containing protein [Candidatus Nomurabacteria bacterium]
MKKILLSLFLVLSFLVPSVGFAQVASPNPNPLLPPACTILTFNMKVGATDAFFGGQVSKLQLFLIANGFLVVPAGVPLGFFGIMTQNAVIKFQIANNINPAVGFVGPVTRAMIQWLTCGVAANPVVPNNNPVVPVNPVNPGVLNNPNVFGLNPNLVNPLNPVVPVNPVNPVPPVVPPVNPTTTTVVPVPPVVPNPAPCGPGVMFNTVTGALCNPNPVNPVACTPASLPSITVLSPNGGETIVIDTATDIKWTSCNVVDTVRLSLVNQTNVNPLTNVIYPLLNQTGNDGFETVKITQPAGMPAFQLGTRFKIRIDVASVNAVGANPVMIMDDSDNFFTIN